MVRSLIMSGLNKEAIEIETQPWHESYKKAEEALPSWAKHGMPHLYRDFIYLARLSAMQNGMNGVHVDIGCGNGIKTVNYALAGLNTIGVDISREGFSEALRSIDQLGIAGSCFLTQGSCAALPLREGVASSVTDTLCFTHLHEDDQAAYIAEVSRILRTGSPMMMVLFSDKDEHFHGHKVSRRYNFHFDPTNSLMAGYEHYEGMYNVHYGQDDIEKTFQSCFTIVNLAEVQHPVYAHRRLWNVILRKD